MKDIKSSLNTRTEDLSPDAREIKLDVMNRRASLGIEGTEGVFAADPIVRSMSREQLEASIAETTRLMKKAAKELDFIQAAQYRDEIVRLQAQLETK